MLAEIPESQTVVAILDMSPTSLNGLCLYIGCSAFVKRAFDNVPWQITRLTAEFTNWNVAERIRRDHIRKRGTFK